MPKRTKQEIYDFRRVLSLQHRVPEKNILVDINDDGWVYYRLVRMDVPIDENASDEERKALTDPLEIYKMKQTTFI